MALDFNSKLITGASKAPVGISCGKSYGAISNLPNLPTPRTLPFASRAVTRI
jgi:hypothetical protein